LWQARFLDGQGRSALMSPHEAIGRCDSRTDSRGGDRAVDRNRAEQNPN
jgi:hypothetical protein